MTESKNKNTRLPKSKGTDSATVYMPNECRKKVKNIVLNEHNQEILHIVE